MSVGLSIEAPDLVRLQERLLMISRENFVTLIEGIGALVEGQTKNRIRNEKTDPTGKPWADWSRGYAASKHGRNDNHDPHPSQLRSSQGHTILHLDGDLDDSIQWTRTFDELEWGSNLVYARAQNEKRQFLGLSEANEDEVMEVIEDFVDDLMGPLR